MKRYWMCTIFSLIVILLFVKSTRAEDEEKPSGLPGGIYDKPYLGRLGNRAVIGGYIDHEFEWSEGKNSTFDQHRFIPFIYSGITERLHVSAEIEFEHGGLVKGSGSSEGEIKLEYAIMDFRFSEAFNYRGGVILSPLGKFNLLHDSPLNDLTERPTVNRQIMPSTLSEAGMGIFGTFYPSELSVVNYELYLVNGFNDKVINSGDQLRVRSGRGSQKADNNHNKAVVGHLSFSPRLGVDLGLSFHSGAYDQAGDLNLSIIGADGKITRGILEVQGEYARVIADVISPVTADVQQGAYGQVNIHFAHDYFLPQSVFTGVLRWDWVDYDADRTGDSEQGLTFGLNFRPVEDAAFKLDYNSTWKTPTGGLRGDAAGRFFFSVSTYF